MLRESVVADRAVAQERQEYGHMSSHPQLIALRKARVRVEMLEKKVERLIRYIRAEEWYVVSLTTLLADGTQDQDLINAAYNEFYDARSELELCGDLIVYRDGHPHAPA
jgi:hypothetical protein